MLVKSLPFKRPTSRLGKLALVATKPLHWLLLRSLDRETRITFETVFADGSYRAMHSDIAKWGLAPAVDYYLFGAAEGRDPHPLFSKGFYLERNPDVRDSGQDPLMHYVRFGAKEGRDPHWLFNTNFYLERYPEVRQEFNPLLHYLSAGQREHRKTSPFFEPEFYIGLQADVCRSGRGALAHYVQYGFREGRIPSAEFDPSEYLQLHPDVARAGLDPFRHYVMFGAAERRLLRKPRLESAVADHYLPRDSQTTLVETPARDHAVDIVIPVYRGRLETRACIESVLASTNRVRTRIVVINDATPEPDLANYLNDLSAKGLIHLISHPANIGFVGSVNEGMLLSSDSDVVLLNSDTEVFGNWVDRLLAHAYSGQVASVTPFSNNATICSYPKFCENNPLPADISAADLDKGMFAANAGRHCVIPTAVGFCMYIRRDALAEIGLFDQATFGRGYGEENDFCMRAMYRGWVNLLAADTFVYHAGSVSFGPATEAQQRAMDALLKKHPRYMDHVGWHFQINPANAFRISSILHRMRNVIRSVRINVIHRLGGGTLEYANKLEQLTRDQVTWISLEPADDRCVRLYCDREGYEFSVILDTNKESALLKRILHYLQVERVHVQHLLGFPLDIRTWIMDWGIPYDVTLHDYYFVCPRINFKDEDGRYCGETSCRCAEVFTNESGHLDLFSWRASHGAFLTSAHDVIAPSADTAERFQRYYPWLNVIPAWHEFYSATVTARDIKETEPLRIAVLGIMSKHKGFYNMRDCVRLAAKLDAPVEFKLIGGFGDEMKAYSHEIVSTGWYKPDDLPKLLDRYAPHLVWFPCQWPETFSYTLSACLRAGLPVAVPDLGAFAERLNGRDWSWVLPWNTSPEQWLNFFVRIRGNHFRKKLSPPAPRGSKTVYQDFYPETFLASTRTKGGTSTTRQAKRRVMALPAIFKTGQVQACGYIRLVQPLTHPAIADDLDFHVVDMKTALRTQADALVVQRTAINTLDDAAKLIEHCHKTSTRLIYEIDDDLFRLPEEHPEHSEYAVITQAAKLIARAADAVTVSTEALRHMLSRYNENVILIPNYLDERLWPRTNQNSRPSLDKTVRALYMGTASHRLDLEMLEKPVRLIKEKYAFDLTVIGITDDPGVAPWFKCRAVPDHLCGSYPNFVKWLRSDVAWDIGLAPLNDSRFNAHKSGIKTYDYAALGLPTIASSVPAYSSVIEDGKTGLLVPNTVADWYDSLSLLCESSRLRQRLTTEVQAKQKRYTLAGNAEHVRAGWQEALFGVGVIRSMSASTF